ncbi:MAG: DNA polymerase IV [Acidobacteria bacterium]|nr:DNA polymerase IV [Acidobacteriota bacterium]
MPIRTIFHVDMDAFFVSVEELFDPSLKGKPVVVGGRANERGVVSAASYAARKYGVHSAMPLRRAYQLCPKAVFLPGHPSRYRDYSGKVHEVLKKFSPRVEMASIDEAYLEMTGTERLLGPPLAAGQLLHDAIAAETKLPCSIGIGTSRLVAKICSAMSKPHGMLCVTPGAEAAFLAPLDIRKIPGVGKVTEKGFRERGIHKIGQLSELGEAYLEKTWGKLGLALAGKAQGLDAGAWFQGEIGAVEYPKSISHETTFSQDTADVKRLESTLAKLSQMVGRRLRGHGLYGRTIQIKLRYSDFSTFTRAHSLDEATQLDTVILETVQKLFRRNWKQPRPIRLLGVHVAGLEESPGQLDLIEEDRKRRWGQALRAVDTLRDRFGEGSVGLASAIGHGRQERVHENPAGLPGHGGDKDE